MRKVFEFKVNQYRIKIVNSWFTGAKLYVDGDLKDADKTYIANGRKPLLSAKLGELGILDIYPLSKFWSVEMSAYLVTVEEKRLVFSSHERLSLRERRLTQ